MGWSLTGFRVCFLCSRNWSQAPHYWQTAKVPWRILVKFIIWVSMEQFKAAEETTTHSLCVPHLLSHLILVVLWSSWFYFLLQRRKLRLGEINLVKISHRVNGRNNIQAKFICLKTHALFTMSPCLSKWSKKITLCSLYTAICKAPPESIWNISVCVNNSSIT